MKNLQELQRLRDTPREGWMPEAAGALFDAVVMLEAVEKEALRLSGYQGEVGTSVDWDAACNESGDAFLAILEGK